MHSTHNSANQFIVQLTETPITTAGVRKNGLVFFSKERMTHELEKTLTCCKCLDEELQATESLWYFTQSKIFANCHNCHVYGINGSEGKVF